MIRIIAYLISYYRVYRLNKKLTKLDVKKDSLEKKRKILLTAITAGYANESEFIERITTLSGQRDRKTAMEQVQKSFELSRKISAEVAKATMEVNANNG